MNAEKAGCVNDLKGVPTTKKEHFCVHQRRVEVWWSIIMMKKTSPPEIWCVENAAR